jgi:hypothetical protein
MAEWPGVPHGLMPLEHADAEDTVVVFSPATAKNCCISTAAADSFYSGAFVSHALINRIIRDSRCLW